MRRPRLSRSVPRSLPVFTSPLVRRVIWHVSRMRGQLDRRFFLIARRGDRRLRPHRGGPHHALREVVDVRVGLRLVQLGDRDGPRPGRLRLRHVAGRPAHRLVAHPVRGRHARHDHRRPRRDGHRFPAQGGPGLGCFRVQGPHRRLRLEHHRPGPDRGAPGRRLPARRSSSSPTSTRTRPVTASTSSAATSTSEEDLERAGHRGGRRPRSSSRPTRPTTPTCTRS